MKNDRQFEEPLPCGGVLRVRPQSWEIQYTFPGPDRRYKTVHASIAGREVPDYVKALQENWAELERLKAQLPGRTSYETQGKKGMTIKLGTFDGLYLMGRRKAIATKGQVDNTIRSYEYAIEKAVEFQALLRSL